ncbi:unnamed protein product [Effrenium voratum]|nr:unnamed protein product [Effrenium voratum]
MLGSLLTRSGLRPKQDAISLDLLNGIKERYDRFTESREQVIKRSRDVGKGAKNAVYALQREDFKKADQILSQCAKEAEAIFKEHVLAAPTLRGGGFSAALEELAEAVSYRSFRKDRKLLNKAELQTATDLNFELTLPEYLGGILDLTGEVGRLAVRQASRGREAVHEVELCLACVEGVCCGIQERHEVGKELELVYLPGVGKKMFAAKATLLKIEGVLYELVWLQSHRRKRPTRPMTADGWKTANQVTHLPSGESWAVQRRLTEWLRLEERMSRECGKAMRHASVLRSCVGSRRSGILRDAPRRQMDRLQARLSEMLSDETLKSSAALQDFLGVQAPEMPSSVRIVNLIQGDEAQVHLEVHTCDDTELAQAMATHVDATVLLLSQSTGVEDVELESFRVPAASPATVAIAGLQPSNMYEFQVRAANSVGSSASVCIRILVPENADCETGIAASTVPAPAAPEAAHALERQSDDEGVATSASPVLSAPEAAKALGRQSDDEGVAPAATLAPALAAPEAEAAPRALQRQADEGAGVAPAAALAPALAAPEAEAAPRALQRQAGEGAGAASSAAPALAAPEEVQALARPLGDEGVAPAATLASALAVPDQQQTAQGAGITTVPIAETKAAAKSREEGQLKLKQPSPGYARIGSIEVRVSQLPENKAPGEALDALVLLQERYEISEQAALRLFLGCNFDLQEAIRRYDGILEWRKLHRADELRQELISQLQSCKELKPSFQQEVGKLVTVNPCALMTTDGSPVTLYHVGTAQAAAAGKARDDQLQRWGVFTSEYIDLWLTHQTAASGRLAGHVQIYDLHNVSFWQVSSGALVEKFRVLLGAGQNYMEQVSHIFVIRSGSIFTMAWKFVKGWVSPRTASKIHVSSDIPRELLELLGPGSALPGLLQSPQWSAPVLRPLAVSPA